MRGKWRRKTKEYKERIRNRPLKPEFHNLKDYKYFLRTRDTKDFTAMQQVTLSTAIKFI